MEELEAIKRRCDSRPPFLTLQDEGGEQEQGVGAERLGEGQVPAHRRPSGPQPGRLGPGRRPGVPQPASRLQLRCPLLHPAGITPRTPEPGPTTTTPAAGNLSEGHQTSRLCSLLQTGEEKIGEKFLTESQRDKPTVNPAHHCFFGGFFASQCHYITKLGTQRGCRLRSLLLVRSTFAVIC